MTTHDLMAMYHEALRSLRELRAKAGLPEPELEDAPGLREEARRFAQFLTSVPDASTAEIAMLADHAGLQSFWQFARTHWEQLELSLIPSAFELTPNPLPYEIVAQAVLALLETVPLAVHEPAPGAGSDRLAGSVDAPVGEGTDSLRLSPRIGTDGTAGAVWEFKDVY